VGVRGAFCEEYPDPGGPEACERNGGWPDIGAGILTTSSSLTSQEQRALNSQPMRPRKQAHATSGRRAET
jgi:hypothetical protein